MANNFAHDPYNRRHGRVLTINDLPDDVLLETFRFYVAIDQRYGVFFLQIVEERCSKEMIESWKLLVHVCRRWRDLVFESPRSLNLQICCGPSRSGRKSLDVWPPLPVIVRGDVTEELVENIIRGLEHRICQINLKFSTTQQIERLSTAMQVPFPELVYLRLSNEDSPHVPVLPESFLGGSAPHLRYFSLDGIPFPGLPKLLLSTTHLVELWLRNIPHSGYISPETMVTCLSMLTSLESLHLEFKSPQSHPDLKSRRPFMPIRSVLPTLAIFRFKGGVKYLEEFVVRIDAPQLYLLSTTLFNDIDNGTPELKQFISRTPTLGAYDEARFIFDSRKVLLELRHSQPESSGPTTRMVELKVGILHLSTLAQICLSLRPLLTMENLYVCEDRRTRPTWKGDIENTEWLDLLLPFTAVKNLYLSKLYSPRIALALQEFAEGRTTEVLPNLQNVFLEGFQSSKSVQEQFTGARQLTNPPVAISTWNRGYWGY